MNGKRTVVEEDEPETGTGPLLTFTGVDLWKIFGATKILGKGWH